MASLRVSPGENPQAGRRCHGQLSRGLLLPILSDRKDQSMDCGGDSAMGGPEDAQRPRSSGYLEMLRVHFPRQHALCTQMKGRGVRIK